MDKKTIKQLSIFQKPAGFFKKYSIFVISLLLVTALTLIYIMFSRIEVVIFAFFIAAAAAFVFYLMRDMRRRMAEKDDQLRRISSEAEKLKKEKETLASTRVNIQSVKDILELNMLKVETKTYRVIKENIMEKGRIQARCFGVMRLDITAKYGIDLHQVSFAVDDTNRTVLVINAVPKISGFEKRGLSWEIDECVQEEKNILGIGLKVVNEKLLNEFARIKEAERIKFEKEIEDRGIEEFKPFMALLRVEIENALNTVFGPKGYTARLADLPVKTAVAYNEFMENPDRYLKQ
jgi:hypothetical protein